MVQNSVMTGALKREMVVMKTACGSAEMEKSTMMLRSATMEPEKMEMDAMRIA